MYPNDLPWSGEPGADGPRSGGHAPLVSGPGLREVAGKHGAFPAVEKNDSFIFLGQAGVRLLKEDALILTHGECSSTCDESSVTDRTLASFGESFVEGTTTTVETDDAVDRTPSKDPPGPIPDGRDNPEMSLLGMPANRENHPVIRNDNAGDTVHLGGGEPSVDAVQATLVIVKLLDDLDTRSRGHGVVKDLSAPAIHPQPQEEISLNERLLSSASPSTDDSRTLATEPARHSIPEPTEEEADSIASLPVVEAICLTQLLLDQRQRVLDQQSCFKICIGCDRRVFRWKPGSTVLFYFDIVSFSMDGDLAKRSFLQAVEDWTQFPGIGITFCETDDEDEATFYVRRRGKPDNGAKALAHAFPPNDHRKRKKRTLFVYDMAFREPRPNLAGVFGHELGHILGARHEFAKDEDKPWETKDPSVRIGSVNHNSVMRYPKVGEPWRVDDLDRQAIKSLYDFKGSHYTNEDGLDFEVTDVDPNRQAGESVPVVTNEGANLVFVPRHQVFVPRHRRNARSI